MAPEVIEGVVLEGEVIDPAILMHLHHTHQGMKRAVDLKVTAENVDDLMRAVAVEHNMLPPNNRKERFARMFHDLNTAQEFLRGN